MPTLTGLNPPQIEAVTHYHGPILVLAGAGSGKTRVLTRRVAHLVAHHNVSPQSILAVTFTNKATEEMRERLFELLGTKAGQLWVSTFHSACLRILRRHAGLLGYSGNFTVYDDQDSRALIKSILKDMKLAEKRYAPGMFSRTIDEAKNSFISVEEYRKEARSPDAFIASQVYERYQQGLLKANAMDFGDLLVNAVALFQQQPDILAQYQRAIRFVLVDEFQDTNLVQYMFVSMLTRPHRNLLVVGDDDQSIYSFRGASIKNILEFEKEFDGTKVVKLEQNYRSTANILEAAHAVIARNKSRKDKKLWTSAGAGEKITAWLADDEIDEGEFIASEVQQLIKSGLRLKDIAIFYRTNAQSRAIEEALINAALPYRIFGGLKFYERKEVKDVLAYLQLLVNPADDQAFLRIINYPPRGIGQQTVRSIIAHARERKSSLLEAIETLPSRNTGIKGFQKLIGELQSCLKGHTLSELIRKVVELSEYAAMLKAARDTSSESRLENLLELQAIGRSLESPGVSTPETLRNFLDRVALTGGGDQPSDEHHTEPQKDGMLPPDMLSLMTLHLAKGLEYPVVFLTGLEEGLLPHHRSLGDRDGIEEERRLCYVGFTRAMKKLYISRALMRGIFMGGDSYGFGGMFRDASRFAYDIPPQLLDERGRGFLMGGASGLDETSLELDEETQWDIDGENKDYSSLRPARKKQKPRKEHQVIPADDLADK